MDLGEYHRSQGLSERRGAWRSACSAASASCSRCSISPSASRGWSLPTATTSTVEHYDFRYVRREFLGDVRCLVFDVTPKKDAGKGRFLGRIWVEDQDFNIVRLNGTYAPRPRNAYFFHMDSWRLNLIPGYWVPALHLQRRRRLQRRRKEQDGLQGADPHLGLRPEEGRQGRRVDQRSASTA